MGERDVGEARSREGRERRAAEGRDRPTAKEGEGAETDLAPPGLDEAQIEHVRRQLGDSLSRKMSTGPDALTGPELVEVADLVSRLRRARNVRGVDDWVAFEESQNARHMRDAIGELRSVERRAAENTGRIYEIGQDAHAPVREGTINARNPKGDPMKSFDIAERDGNEVVRSIEATSASTPAKGAPDLTEGVRHATDKAVGRIKEKVPIPGKELEVEIRIELFKGEAGAGKGTVTYDGAGNYTYKVNNGTITPSKFGLHKNPGNIFADFAKELPKIGGSNTLSVVTLVDGSGKVIATFRREGSIWKWLQESTP